jgi:hypothetical protein
MDSWLSSTIFPFYFGEHYGSAVQFLFLIASNVYNMYIYVLILYETLDTKQFIPSLILWFGLLSHAIESFISFLCLL